MKVKKKRLEFDPVCGRRINRNRAHISVEYKGKEYLLCCRLCQAEFEKDPEKYAARVREV
jgi:YHS domain-containing protein